ncbi:hypothetical protein K1719_038719 [Acacia pycnantha]|nr:hypothetical protein K1719_038719 [Acacia pycnantha]
MAANDAGDSDSSSSSSLPQSPVGKKGRGPTQLKGLTARRVRGPVRIEFDDDLNPIGPDEDRFVSYIGYLSRTHVGINIPNWRKVDQTTRDMIWAQILQLSESGKKRRALNLYDHCMSRSGYRKTERKMMQDDLKRQQEAAKSDPSIVVQSPRRPQRHLKWKAGRIKKGGGYVNTTVEGIARKIDELSQQSEEGSFTSSGRMDILATAIGKPDHPGQVRGSRGESVSPDILDGLPHILDLLKSLLRRLEEMAELHRQEMAEQRRLIAEQQRYFESMLSS